MAWEEMSLEEYAEYEKGNGTPIVKVGDIHWRRVRPFFFRPLFPFQKLHRGENVPPRRRSWVYQHAVHDIKQANSFIKLMVFNQVQDYSINALKSKRRNKIRKAMRNLEVRVVEDQDYFCEMAYKVYLDFYQRTGYSYKKERLTLEGFAKWAENIFKNRKIKVHGVFDRDDQMVAIHLSYLVNKILLNGAFFSTSKALHHGVTDLMDHVIMEEAAIQKNILLIYDGPYHGNPGLDDSKRLRGFDVFSVPAYLSANSIILKIIKSVNRNLHHKLTGY